MKQPRRRIVVHYDRLKPYHGQFESSISASSETMTPTDQSGPATQSDYEDDPIVVYPPPSVQTSDENSLRRSSRIRRTPDRYGNPVAH